MKNYLLVLFFLTVQIQLIAQRKMDNELPIKIDIEKIKLEENKENYNLENILKIIENSIIAKDEIIIPKDVTEFEKVLFIVFN